MIRVEDVPTSNLSPDGYSLLASAIVMQAARDWRLARHQPHSNRIRLGYYSKDDLITFFQGEWFEFLTDTLDIDRYYFLRVLCQSNPSLNCICSHSQCPNRFKLKSFPGL